MTSKNLQTFIAKSFLSVLLSFVVPVCSFSQGWFELGNGTSNSLQLAAAYSAIYSIAVDASGNVYANGLDPLTSNVAVYKWSGSNWNELGSGASGLNANNNIRSIATDAAGNVYAAGYFLDTISAPTLNGHYYYVAKWNGSNWAELGTGNNALKANGAIEAVITDSSNNVYAAGYFMDPGINNYVAKWDGNTWTELGTGLNALPSHGNLECLAMDTGGHILVAGDFSSVNGHNGVEKWNGSNWTEVGGLNSLRANGMIRSIAVDKYGDVYAAGEFTDANGKYYVAWNDGGAWLQLGGANGLATDSPIYHITIDASNNVYAVGDFTNANGKYYVAKWDWTSWSEVGVGANALNANSVIFSVAANGGDVYAAGAFTDAGQMPYVAEYSPTLGLVNMSNTANNLRLYPNPASGTVTISLKNNSANAQVHITDMVGRGIYTDALNTTELSVNVSDWSNGMYFCTVYEGDVRNTVKFVVAH
jgi:hypothetical protein